MAAAQILADKIIGRENPNAEVFSPIGRKFKAQILVNAFTSVGNLLCPLPHRCSHLGCALRYNKAEHSWDCPCHGSRFSKKGKILDGPANRPL
jgi:nitrite reductase/ring-hydroxylating ferredoxin subunit